MRKFWMAATLCAAMGAALAGTPAMADDWGRHDDDRRGGWTPEGGRYGHDGRWGGNWGGDWRIRAVCSGARADRLEDRLRREVREGDIGRWQARRISDQIDRLEDRQRHECAQRDWGSIRAIAGRYDGIDRWIDREVRDRW